MSSAPGGDGLFVGRAGELELVRSAIEAARAGSGGALLVSGDAGVGKTALVERACALAGDGALVLQGSALPLSSMTVPLLALRGALRGVPAGERPPLFERSEAGRPLPDAPVLFDEWLELEGATRPVLLVVDDLHWADQSTLDVLMYVVAGAASRRVSLLTTMRLGEAGEGHPLTRWLADVRRMPSFAELTLAPLDRAATREQLAGLLGAPPHETLVDEVFSRTLGNAYFNRLLVTGLPGTATHLGRDLPEDLRGAVLHAWNGLSPPARELVRTVAVGGQVASRRHLDRAATLAGVTDPGPLLREAVDSGILEMDPLGGYWFHHPLQAEALEGSLAAGERARLHAAYAGSCEADLDPVNPDLESVTIVADHHYFAGQADAAYTWALRAVDAAERSGGAFEQLRMLRRALDLRAVLPDANEPTDELLDRLRRTAEELGDFEEELAAVERLLGLLDEEREPLRVAPLLVRREHLRFCTGRGFLAAEGPRRAVELTRGDPTSWQHAYALAELTQACLWADDPEASSLAAPALVAARASGDDRALAYALAANAMLAVFEERYEEGVELGARAVQHATRARDTFAFVHAALWEANATAPPSSPLWVNQVQGRRGQLEAMSGPHPNLAWISACEAGALLHLGDWEACAERLRVALGSYPGVLADVNTRLVAGRLAVLQGRQAEAEAHLARAEELFGETSTFIAYEFDAVRAMVRLGAGDLDGVVEAAMTGATVDSAPPTMCEWLMPLAARALADQAQALRDAGQPPDAPLARLEQIVQRFPQVIRDNGENQPTYVRQLAALDSLYAAEQARAKDAPDGAQRWTSAVELFDGILPWDHAYACWRAGEALLVRGSSDRAEAAEVLRAGHDLALRLRAAPVVAEIEELARTARIALTTVASQGDASRSGVLPGLTAREREVLDHLVAGRTYGEIAKALVVSEKTVSTHVSHLLRKTGTANRIDLARLARTASSQQSRDPLSGS